MAYLAIRANWNVEQSWARVFFRRHRVIRSVEAPPPHFLGTSGLSCYTRGFIQIEMFSKAGHVSYFLRHRVIRNRLSRGFNHFSQIITGSVQAPPPTAWEQDGLSCYLASPRNREKVVGGIFSVPSSLPSLTLELEKGQPCWVHFLPVVWQHFTVYKSPYYVVTRKYYSLPRNQTHTVAFALNMTGSLLCGDSDYF